MRFQLSKIGLLAFVLQNFFAAALLQPNDILELKDTDEIIRVTEDTYSQLQYGVEGEYSVLYFTIYQKDEEDNYKCQMCIDFEENLRRIVQIIKNQRPDTPISYYLIDAYEVPSLIREMGIENVPHLVVYPPPNMATQMIQPFSWATSQFYQYQLTPEHSKDFLHFGNFLANILNIYIEIDTGFETDKFIRYFSGSIGFFVILKKVIWPLIKERNISKIVMMLISFGILLPSITGYTFTQINRVPFLARDGEGNVMFFSGGTGWQFGMEVFSVSSMYIAMAGLLLLLIGIKSEKAQELIHERVDNVLTIFLAFALFHLFSYFISCFMIKSPGYPYPF